MPADPLVTAIVSSIISSVAESMLTPTPPPPDLGIIRELPEDTRKGVMTAPGFGQVTIDGTLYALSPGVQIRNEMNMLVMPTMLDNRRSLIRYQVDFLGYVYRIWILSSSEVMLPQNK